MNTVFNVIQHVWTLCAIILRRYHFTSLLPFLDTFCFFHSFRFISRQHDANTNFPLTEQWRWPWTHDQSVPGLFETFSEGKDICQFGQLELTDSGIFVLQDFLVFLRRMQHPWASMSIQSHARISGMFTGKESCDEAGLKIFSSFPWDQDLLQHWRVNCELVNDGW